MVCVACVWRVCGPGGSRQLCAIQWDFCFQVIACFAVQQCDFNFTRRGIGHILLNHSGEFAFQLLYHFGCQLHAVMHQHRQEPLLGNLCAAVTISTKEFIKKTHGMPPILLLSSLVSLASFSKHPQEPLKHTLLIGNVLKGHVLSG